MVSCKFTSQSSTGKQKVDQQFLEPLSSPDTSSVVTITLNTGEELAINEIINRYISSLPLFFFLEMEKKVWANILWQFVCQITSEMYLSGYFNSESSHPKFTKNNCEKDSKGLFMLSNTIFILFEWSCSSAWMFYTNVLNKVLNNNRKHWRVRQ